MTEAVMRSAPVAATSLISGFTGGSRRVDVRNPARLGDTVGSVVESTPEDATRAVDAASASMRDWDALGVEARAAIVDRVADAWESAHDELAALIVREAGRTMLDAHMEVREAIDFCRYYAALGRAQMTIGAAAGTRG